MVLKKHGGHLELNVATRIFNIFFNIFNTHDGNITKLSVFVRDQIEINLLYDENGYEGHYKVLLKKGKKQKWQEIFLKNMLIKN